jgi:hypothetical protein
VLGLDNGTCNALIFTASDPFKSYNLCIKTGSEYDYSDTGNAIALRIRIYSRHRPALGSCIPVIMPTPILTTCQIHSGE